MYMTQALHRLVQQEPDRPLTVYQGRIRTVAESADRVARLAGALRSAGVGPGDRVGMLSLNGDINTGILIRTVHLRDGIARYSAGATLLYDSVPAQEEEETRLKATGFFRALNAAAAPGPVYMPRLEDGRGVRLLLVDAEDCFIHTLANYARQTGAEVVTYRAGFPVELIAQVAPNLILISPGPGRPVDFGVPDVVKTAVRLGVPVFGVCLGLQGIVFALIDSIDPLPRRYPPTLRREGENGVGGGRKQFRCGLLVRGPGPQRQ